jgi:hypothetical protein
MRPNRILVSTIPAAGRTRSRAKADLVDWAWSQLILVIFIGPGQVDDRPFASDETPSPRRSP